MDQSILDHADYVIIGAGSAGCVLAARLSEDPGTRVVLVEAGGSGSGPIVSVPVGYAKAFGNPAYDWCYSSAPEPGLGGRSIYHARGKVLGGSSSINGLAWVHGLPHDYDGWAAQGCTGWDWQTVNPYFARLETFKPGGARRGTDGPIGVEYNNGWHDPCRKIAEAGVQAGVPTVEDYNMQSPGIARAQLNVSRGRRVSAAVGYLKPARGRPNLQVITNVTVEHLLVENGAATGIAMRTDSGSRQLQAAREVILCAGAIGSPLLLERSGIGDAARLQALGIAVKANRPEVGENLRDHLLVMMNYRIRGLRTINDESRGLRALLNGAAYMLARRGLLSGTPTELMGYGRAMPGDGPADIQFFGAPMTYTLVNKGGKISIGLDREPGMSFGMYHCRPKSRGHVHAAQEPGWPTIQANYLTEQADQDATLAGMRLCRRIAAQPAITPYIVREIAPSVADESDAALLDYARAQGSSGAHPVGTCRMGADKGSVVDTALRVRGVRRLRVIDASIMPDIVSANTNAPTMMIAERGADLIRRRVAAEHA